MKPHVLVVYPHPDDETFGPGGTIILHAQAGTPVTYLCGTLGQMGRNMGNPIMANRETLPKLRKLELQQAAKILGISDLRMMGYHDKTVEFEDREVLVKRILDVIEEIQPTVVYTYYPGHAVHPDHEAMAEATVEALSRIPAEQRPVLYCQAISNNRLEALGEPDVSVDITSVAEIKLQAIKAHYTQTAQTAARLEKAYANKDPEIIPWLTVERFYTYRWE
ncbi:bacillithiol biosynthesis deacetylase BshB2 [Brevibacillus fulvus]|uniref:Bacillithiol biosynthesis deacetylase BshB2 n=1 Tax=Brevibacillus fulvus TaxID=1125967 RepID=A0A938XW59_9BACL|nr:bacillithiol biosynthesis deacetylase BshB2 [Brevibacillus fulvus]MBM7589209.1 bacillithiol biosynthesis deacetylase BshB2 [Brevibacillus fulvus]